MSQHAILWYHWKTLSKVSIFLTNHNIPSKAAKHDGRKEGRVGDMKEDKT